MPLFYFRPFDFHADKKEPVKVIDFNTGDIVLFGTFMLVALALFVVFVVIPVLTVLAES